MVYLLVGENSYRALKKITDIKLVFFEKGGKNFSIVDINGEESSAEEIVEFFSAQSLFETRRLIILKNSIEAHPRIVDIIQKNKKGLTESPDVFVFWERNFLKNQDALSLLKSIAKKTEETSQRTPEELVRWLKNEASARNLPLHLTQCKEIVERQLASKEESPEWALSQELEKISLGDYLEKEIHQKQKELEQNAIFSFADKIFGNKFARALVVFRESKQRGIDEAELIRICLWKLKNIFLIQHGESKKLNSYVAQKAFTDGVAFQEKNIFDAFWDGIVTDSALKRDSKNTEEHIEKYILSMKGKIT